MSQKWRLWCNVHNWVYGWSDEPITVCPIENADPVDISKTFKIGEEKIIFNLSTQTTKTDSSNYERVLSTVYDSNIHGPLSNVKIMAYMSNNVNNYSVEIYDQTNDVSLCSGKFTNTGDYETKNLDLISSPPEGKVILNVNIKRDASGKNKYAYISGVIFCTRNSQ